MTVTVRPDLRPRVLLVLLLLAVLAHSALGAILACQFVEERPVALISAVSDQSPAGACPGCLLEQPRATADVVPPLASLEQPAAVQDPCMPARPCQHGPNGEHGSADAGTGPVQGQRDIGPALVCLVPSGPPPGRPGTVPGGTPIAAALTSVAVLCVDRN